jgi:lysophospholipase L1-like esterase
MIGMSKTDILAGARRIVCLGASMTEQGDLPGGWVSLIREALAPRGIEVVNAGIGGNQSRHILERFQADVVARRPDVVLTCCGVNDVWHGFDDAHPEGGGPGGVSVEEYRENFRALVRLAQQAGIRVALFTMTILQERPDSRGNVMLEEYVAALRDVAGETDSLFVDVFHPFLDEAARLRAANDSEDLQLTVDGVHLTEAGNALMAGLTLRGLGVQ